MELRHRIIIRFLYREHAEPQDTHARLSARFGDTPCSLRSVQRWCLYIRQGRELLVDEPRSGRPPIDFLDIQILSSVEKQPFHLVYSLAEILDVSHTTILNHLRDLLGMKMFHLHWIPNQLSTENITYLRLLSLPRGHITEVPFFSHPITSLTQSSEAPLPFQKELTLPVENFNVF
jgi:DNA-binding transcriptional ArsR family regulator